MWRYMENNWRPGLQREAELFAFRINSHIGWSIRSMSLGTCTYEPNERDTLYDGYMYVYVSKFMHRYEYI